MRWILNASSPTRLATTAAIVILTAVAATFLVDSSEATPEPVTEDPVISTSHPCAGLPSIYIVIDPNDTAAGEEIVRRSKAPSGKCALTATVRSNDSSTSDSPSAAVGTCTIQVNTDAGTDGTVAQVTPSGACRHLRVNTRIALSAAGARAAQANLFVDAALPGASSGTSIARARIGVYGLAPSGRIQSDVRGTWGYTSTSVNLISLTYPTLNTTSALHEGTSDPSTTYGVSPPSIEGRNDIPWLGNLDELKLETSVMLTMLAGGGYHCTHSYQAYSKRGPDDLSSLGARVNIRGECFP